MSRREGDVRLRHMQDHAREAIAMARAKTRADLDTDRQLNLSLVRLLEIVGETASRERTYLPPFVAALSRALETR